MLLPTAYLFVFAYPMIHVSQPSRHIQVNPFEILQAGTQTPGQSAAIPDVQSLLSGSSTHFSPSRHWKPDKVAQIRFSSTGDLVLTTQMPPQSLPPFLGSQESRGSSTQISVPAASPSHWMFPMPPQKTGSGQKPICMVEMPGRTEHGWPKGQGCASLVRVQLGWHVPGQFSRLIHRTLGAGLMQTSFLEHFGYFARPQSLGC